MDSVSTAQDAHRQSEVTTSDADLQPHIPLSPITIAVSSARPRSWADLSRDVGAKTLGSVFDLASWVSSFFLAKETTDPAVNSPPSDFNRIRLETSRTTRTAHPTRSRSRLRNKEEEKAYERSRQGNGKSPTQASNLPHLNAMLTHILREHSAVDTVVETDGRFTTQWKDRAGE